ncbi:stress response protein NST1-like [Limulus polyphemus]|uniref:Stress response protein NST1-like n=1 Tax=Limulus polyphemus TaxID=6850 RepID=A0ABM1SLD6_LIMPO|nr:stress response protein NST1-like [Limulus polyphemus]
MGCAPSRDTVTHQLVAEQTTNIRPTSYDLDEHKAGQYDVIEESTPLEKKEELEGTLLRHLAPKWVPQILVPEEEYVSDSDTETTNTLGLEILMTELSLKKNQASLDSRISNFSFKSWQSSVSCDSGVFELDDEYAFVITEHSTLEKVQAVERDFTPVQNLELIVEGKACPKKLNFKERDKMENEEILEKLREEGLVLKPESRATGGIRFDVVSEEEARKPANSPMVRRLPPLRLQNRAKQRSKRKDLTSDEINEKLEKANERKKQKEEERLRKLTTQQKIDEITSAVAHQAEEKKQKQDEKMEAVIKGREKYLRELQEKSRAHEEKARKVRQRKEMINTVPTTAQQNEASIDIFASGY